MSLKENNVIIVIQIKHSLIGYLFEKVINFNPYLIPYTKNYPKYIIYLNIKPNIIKFLEKDIREKFYELELGKDFIDIIQKS